MSTPEDRLKQQMTLPEFADAVGDKLGIPKILRDSIFERESNFEHYSSRGVVKRSPKGALGVGQLMPGTAERFGVNPHDPLENIYGALKYQKFLYDRYLTATGNEKQAMLLAAAAYNSGEGNVDKFRGIPPFEETQNYVRYVAARIRGQQPKDAQASAVDVMNPESMRAYIENLAGLQEPGGVPPPPTSLQSPKGVESTRRQLMTLTPKEQARLGVPTMPGASVQGEAVPTRRSDTAETFKGGLRGIARLAGLPTQFNNPGSDWTNEAVVKGGAGLTKMSAGIIRSIPRDPLQRNTFIEESANRLNSVANEINAGAMMVDRDARRGFLSQTAQDVLGGTIASAPAMALIALGVPAPVAFGLQSYLDTVAEPNAKLKDILLQTGKGATIGALFELPVPVKLNMLGRIGYRVGTVGGGTGAVELATGADTKSAATNALVNSIFAASGALKRGGVPEKPVTEPRIDTMPDIPDVPVSTISEPRIVKRPAQTELLPSQPATSVPVKPPSVSPIEAAPETASTPSEGGVVRYYSINAKSSPTDMFGGETKLNPVSHSQGAIEIRTDAQGNQWATPNYRGGFETAFRSIFPEITEDQFNARKVKPIAVSKGEGDQLVVAPAPPKVEGGVSVPQTDNAKLSDDAIVKRMDALDRERAEISASWPIERANREEQEAETTLAAERSPEREAQITALRDRLKNTVVGQPELEETIKNLRTLRDNAKEKYEALPTFPRLLKRRAQNEYLELLKITGNAETALHERLMDTLGGLDWKSSIREPPAAAPQEAPKTAGPLAIAIGQRASQFAALKESATTSERHALDLTDDLKSAFDRVTAFKQQGVRVVDAVNADQSLTPFQRQTTLLLDGEPEIVGKVLDNYLKGAEVVGSPQEKAFFEKNPPTKEALLEAAMREAVRDANQESGLPESQGVRPKPETGRSVPNVDTASQPASEGVPRPDRSIERRSSAEAVQGVVPEPPKNLGPGAANINEPFAEVKERSFGKQLMADERLVDDLKESLGTSRYYEPIPNNLTAENAREFVDSQGVPEAMKAIRDEANGMPFHVRVAAGEIVILRLNEAVKNLIDVNPEKARFALDQATEASEWAMDYGTRLGQGVQAFAMWKRLLPEGKLLSFKRVVEKAQKKFEAKRGGENGAEVKQIVNELNQPTITITNAETAEAAPIIRDAIERAMKESGPQSGVPAPPEKQMTIWGQYKDSIAKQLADMAIPKKAKQRPALEEFSDRLLSNVEGLIQRPEQVKAKPDIYGQMREVVENWDKYKEAWNEAITFIRDKYTKQLKIDEHPLLTKESLAELNALERRITDLNSASQTKAFDRVFNDAVKQAELNFRDIAKSHYLDKQATRDALIESIQKDIGIKLSPEEAKAMVSRIEQKLEARILGGREQILKALEQSGNKTAKKVMPITDKLIEAARVGILTEKKFYELAAEKLGLPKYDAKTAETIYELAGKVEDAPEGIPKDRAIFELNKFIAQQNGFGPEDLPYGIYYGNILSGYNTHIVNTVDTALNVISEVNGLAMNNPRAAAKVYAGVLRGLNDGAMDALMVLNEGRMTTDGKWLEVPRLMEIAEFGKKGGVPIRTNTRTARATRAVAESKIATPLNAYKYVTRMLAASDAVFFRSAKEARASLLAYRMAEGEGLKGDALETRSREILALDRQADFLAQAKREGFTGFEAQTRAIELREFVRDKDLSSDAADFAGEATYNHDPHGLLGMFSSGLARWSDTFKPLKLFVPFTRIVANVTNRGLNWTPWGYKRAIFDYTLGEGMTPEARRLMITRATAGTAGLVTLGATQYSGLLQIHGNGPSDSERRRQLMSAGWKPYSIEMNGIYISYLNSPLGLGLSVVGNMTDSQRYHELEQKDAGTRGAYAIARIGSTIFSQSFLSGLSRLFEALSSDPAESVNAVKQVMSGTTAAMTTPNLIRDAHKLFDNKQYQSNTFMEDLVRNTPFAALVLRPTLNAFGEPVTLPRQRFVDIASSDPAWQFVMKRGLRVPVPGRTTELKPEQRLTPEQYHSLLQTTGPQLKRWIVENQLRLSGMTEDAAQKELSKAAEKFHEQALDQMEPSRLIMRSIFRGVPRPPEMASPSPTP